MGPIWGQQDPGEPHVGPMNFDSWVASFQLTELSGQCLVQMTAERLRDGKDDNYSDGRECIYSTKEYYL